jgi:ATP-dependent helicase/nuclease subunit B
VTPLSDRRHFLGWDAHALPAAAGLIAEAYAAGDALDLGGTALVVPGGRAGRRLKELLVAEAAQRSLRLVPPRVTTAGALPELLYTPERAIAPPETCRRVWLRQLRRLAAEERALLFPHAPQPEDLRGWLALAGEVSRLHREVGGGGRRFADVVRLFGTMGLHDDAPRWRVLAQLQEGYARELARLGVADRDLARIDALESQRVSCDLDVWLIGLAEMPGVLRSLLRQLGKLRGAAVHAIVHAPTDASDAFDDLGCVVPEHWLAAEIPVSDERLAVVEHPANQAVSAAACLAGLDGAYGADEIVLGVPDPEVVPYLEQQFAAAGVAVRFAAGYPVERTPLVRLLGAVADVVADDSWDAVAALARHPTFGEWLRRRRWHIDHPGAAAFREEDAWLEALDTFAGERVPFTLAGSTAGSGGRGRAVAEALRTALLGDEMLGALRGRRALRDWMPRILRLVLELYGDTKVGREDPRERRLLGAAQALRNAAVPYTRVPPALDEECDAATAIRLLLDDVAGEALPPEADDAAIELLGWLELHLDDAPVAVLTGMNDAFVPGAVNADAFLPNALRSLLGLEDNDRRYARDAYQLTAMLHSRRVHAVAGRRSMRGDPLRPSRLLLATSGRTLARRVRAFFPDDGDVRAAATPPAAAAPSRFRLPPEPVLSLPEVPDSLSVTEFGAILDDPYAWALDRLVGRVAEDGVRELDPLRFGSLAHDVLEEFGRSPAAASADEAEVAASLESILDALVARTFGEVVPAVRLQVEQLRMRLRAFAAAQARRVADGWTTVGVECSAADGGVPLEVDGTVLRVRGRIDRIDYHAGRDEWAVFDYKTGEKGDDPATVHRSKRGEWLDLQLPLYRHILPHVVDADGRRVFTGAAASSGAAGSTASAAAAAPTVRLGYILLCADPAAIRFAEAQWDAADLEDAMNAACDVVRCVRDNAHVFPGIGSGWYTDDMAALLGRGRLVLDDDDALEEEVLA